ncbi:MAG: hypothetical protein HOP28_16175 [Gemmatimonadales bacterium]|nr:hypothetical protein [Gemmatimonadales bacterium]
MTRTHWILVGAVMMVGACRPDMSSPEAGSGPVKPEPATTALQTGTGFIMHKGAPVEVTFEIVNGRAIFQGDIDLGPVERIAKSSTELRRPQTGAVTSHQDERWYRGLIAYAISPSIQTQQRILDAIASIQASVGGVLFIPAEQAPGIDRMFFVPESDPERCGHTNGIGRTAGGFVPTYVHVSDRSDCNAGTVMHEIGHALGFWHEQSRCDRDNYVQILTDSIESGKEHNFAKVCSGADDVAPYDEGSIMHYHRRAFGKPRAQDPDVKTQTIRSLRGRDLEMGQSSAFGASDIITTNMMYQPYPVTTNFDPINYTSGTPRISWMPVAGAISYTVKLITIYNYYDYYENWSNVFVINDEVLITTPSAVFEDVAHPYTGLQMCSQFNTNYSELYYTYRYDIRVNYPGGVVGAPYSFQHPFIAPTSC